MRWTTLAVALCGCDVVFRVDPVERVDAAIADVAIDAGGACRADHQVVAATMRFTID